VERARPHTIRLAGQADAAVIADLIRRAFAAQPRPTDPPSSALRETAGTISAHLARGGGAVLERDSLVLGAVHISRVSVDPGCRRQGIARAMVDEAEREARRRRLPRMTLGVRLELEENRQLFRSCGFEDLELRRHEGYTEPTWVLMERRLT